RALARVLSSLETSIKRTTIPSDPGAARAGGYTVECSSSSSSSKVLPMEAFADGQEDEELRKPFPQCLHELLLQQQHQKQLLPRRHPLAAAVQNLLPSLFDFLVRLQQLWTEEVSDASFPYLRELLEPGADEFLAVQGTASALAGDGAALSRAVLLAFPHCYHLRTLAYRLAGTCALAADAFFLLPDLGDRLVNSLLLPLRQQLPLQHVEQQLRFFWSPVLDAETLPPQPPYPSQQRLRAEWTAVAEAKRAMETESSSSSSSSSSEEERRLGVYLQRVYALSNVGEVLLQQIGSLLHHKTNSVVAAAAANSSSSNGAKTPTNACISKLNASAAVSASPADDEEAPRIARQESNTSLPGSSSSSSSSSANELRLGVYYNAALLQPLVAAVLELQRWPIPAIIHQGHAVLRAVGKTAAKLPPPVPASLLDLCCIGLSQLISSYLDVSPFDPFAFGCASLQQQLMQQQHESGGCTPLQKYITGADAAGSGASLLLDYTGSIYQLLKALV
ncbi:hypothetical protein, conserved, partial [Eimeria tenella]